MTRSKRQNCEHFRERAMSAVSIRKLDERVKGRLRKCPSRPTGSF